jgi:hypothetical protein
MAIHFVLPHLLATLHSSAVRRARSRKPTGMEHGKEEDVRAKSQGYAVNDFWERERVNIRESARA